MKKKTAARISLPAPSPIFTSCVPSSKQQCRDNAKNRFSFSFTDSHATVNDQRQQPEEQQSDSIMDPAASILTRNDSRHCTVIVGTIIGSRSGRVIFCVQRNAAAPPPFLFELSVPMQSLSAEMGSGLLRIALECHRLCDRSVAAGNNATGGSSRNVWKASCNGRDVGYAVRRWPTNWERGVLQSMRTMTAGVGVLPSAEEIDEDCGGGEVLYMRATYDRIVGSKDAVSYHLISPNTDGGSPPQELSVFLLRTRGD